MNKVIKFMRDHEMEGLIIATVILLVAWLFHCIYI